MNRLAILGSVVILMLGGGIPASHANPDTEPENVADCRGEDQPGKRQERQMPGNYVYAYLHHLPRTKIEAGGGIRPGLISSHVWRWIRTGPDRANYCGMT